MKFVDLIDDGQLVRGSVADQFSTQDKLSVFPSLANDGELAFNQALFLCAPFLFKNVKCSAFLKLNPTL